MAERIDHRSKLKEGKAYSSQLKSVVFHIKTDDEVKVIRSSSQKTPEGTMKVVESSGERVTVETMGGKEYTLNGAISDTWLRFPDGKSAGRVYELRIENLEKEASGPLPEETVTESSDNIFCPWCGFLIEDLEEPCPECDTSPVGSWEEYI